MLNTGRGPGIDHDARQGQSLDIPPEHSADYSGERAVRPAPPVPPAQRPPPRGVARVVHERQAAPEPPHRLPHLLPAARGAHHALEPPLAPPARVVAAQPRVPLEQPGEVRRRLLFLRLIAVGIGPLVVTAGVAVGELHRGAQGLPLRERAGGSRRRRGIRGGRGRGAGGSRQGFPRRDGRRRREGRLGGGGGGGAVDPAALVFFAAEDAVEREALAFLAAEGAAVELFAAGRAGLDRGERGAGAGAGGVRAAAPEGVEVQDLLGEATVPFSGREAARALARHCWFVFAWDWKRCAQRRAGDASA